MDKCQQRNLATLLSSCEGKLGFEEQQLEQSFSRFIQVLSSSPLKSYDYAGDRSRTYMRPLKPCVGHTCATNGTGRGSDQGILGDLRSLSTTELHNTGMEVLDVESINTLIL